MGDLFKKVRSAENLHSAWRHVRRSAQASKNPEIRGHAAEFEHQHQRYIERIASQLREGRFEFEPVEGLLKDKKERAKLGKEPRPLIVAPIISRVVQRAILQVLQPRRVADPTNPNTKFVPKVDPRIRKLNEVNRSRYGVGGLMRPYGGVRPAIELVMGAMDTGATHYYQSDIKSFFTKIPTANVVSVVREQTQDDELADIFAEALKVNLKNKDELLNYAALFPANGEGVAQGSSLSALAGNILLFDLDHHLNTMGVTAVRYIDDIFMLSDSQAKLDAAVAHATAVLSGYKFSLYQPVKGSSKASQGLCRDGFTFLGCTIQPNRCVPSKASVDKICADAHEMLSNSKKAIKALAQGGADFDHEQSRSAVVSRVGRKIFGWEKSFAFCTDTQQFRQVDTKIAEYVLAYEAIVDRYIEKLPAPQRVRAIGIPNIERLFLSDRERSALKSSPPIDVPSTPTELPPGPQSTPPEPLANDSPEEAGRD